MARSDAAISIMQFDGSRVLHLAAVVEGAGIRLEAFATEPVAGPLNASQLRAFADAHEVARSNLYSVLPRHEVTVRMVHLPARDPREIASMVELTAGEFVPFPRESLVVKHHVLTELPSGESAVLVVLANRDAIEQHLALLHAAGLDPRQIFLSTACLHAAAVVPGMAPTQRCALVHVDGNGLEIAVIDRGLLQFSRGVAQDGAWNLKVSHNRETLGIEVRDALSAYRRECEDGLGAGTLVPVAGAADLTDLSALLAETTEKDCVDAAFLTSAVLNPAILGGACPAVALGAVWCAAGRAPMVVNLLPESITRARALRGAQQRLLRLAALVAIVLAALGAWFGQAVLQRWLLIRELRAQVTALAPGAEGVAAKQARLQLIARQVDPGGGFLELLSAVAQAAPETGFNITRIEYDRDTGMNIWGRARSMDLVLGEFLGNLRRMGEGSLAMLARAHSEYETAGQERSEAVYQYHVTVPALEEVADAPAAPAR